MICAAHHLLWQGSQSPDVSSGKSPGPVSGSPVPVSRLSFNENAFGMSPGVLRRAQSRRL